MEQNEEITQKLEEVYKQIEAHLEAGVTYYSTPTVMKYGTSGGMLFTLENDIRTDVGNEEMDDGLDLFSVTTQFPARTIVKYTIQKGSPIMVEACSPEMLIKEMKLSMKAKQLQRVEMLKVMEEPAEDSLMNIEVRVKFSKKKIDVEEKQIHADGSVYETDYSSIKDEIEAMYQALDGNIKKMFVALTDGEMVVQTTPAIPGLTSEVVEAKKDLTLDESSLEAIYSFMESHDEAKIAKAVEVLQRNPDFLGKVEKRYLYLVRARLNDAAATLAQFPEAALSKSEVNTLLGKHFDKDFISLSYFDENESKLTVDFIGSMIQSVLDVDAYVVQAVALDDVSELMRLYDASATKAKNAVLAEAATYAEGWYSRISKHLISLELRRVLFEKTQFDEANGSPGLKAFIFFLNINCPASVYLDIFQSDAPDLTEMFWLLRFVPDSSWGDTSVRIPDSPLKMERRARYREGDDGNWEKIYKPSPKN